MLPHDPKGQIGPRLPLPDHIEIKEPDDKPNPTQVDFFMEFVFVGMSNFLFSLLYLFSFEFHFLFFSRIRSFVNRLRHNSRLRCQRRCPCNRLTKEMDPCYVKPFENLFCFLI